MSTTLEPLVSLVTPVYNGTEYLRECMDSVLAQTYQNWEYTIVDNCSTDGSLEIATQFAARDPRIRVRQNQQFLRAIPNHNMALRQVSQACKYIKVVFADDWIFPECLEKMVALAEEQPSVGLVSAYYLEGSQVMGTGLPYPGRRVIGREICREHLLNQLYLFGSANTVLYRADLVRNRDPFYNEENIHADTEVCFALLKSCDFAFVHQVLTFTRVRRGSLTAESTDVQTSFAGMLRILVTYGPDYLTHGELDRCTRRHMSAYYHFLGRNLLRRRSKEFWDFHRNQLIELGPGFSRIRLARAALASIGRALVRPQDAFRGLCQGLRPAV